MFVFHSGASFVSSDGMSVMFPTGVVEMFAICKNKEKRIHAERVEG